ncbi:hypothetical protein MMC25_005098 [Agyrium rufum]|nr:hypothetical protein [Agyrium rufum]
MSSNSYKPTRSRKTTVVSPRKRGTGLSSHSLVSLISAITNNSNGSSGSGSTITQESISRGKHHHHHHRSAREQSLPSVIPEGKGSSSESRRRHRSRKRSIQSPTMLPVRESSSPVSVYDYLVEEDEEEDDVEINENHTVKTPLANGDGNAHHRTAVIEVPKKSTRLRDSLGDYPPIPKSTYDPRLYSYNPSRRSSTGINSDSGISDVRSSSPERETTGGKVTAQSKRSLNEPIRRIKRTSGKVNEQTRIPAPRTPSPYIGFSDTSTLISEPSADDPASVSEHAALPYEFSSVPIAPWIPGDFVSRTVLSLPSSRPVSIASHDSHSFTNTPATTFSDVAASASEKDGPFPTENPARRRSNKNGGDQPSDNPGPPLPRPIYRLFTNLHIARLQALQTDLANAEADLDATSAQITTASNNPNAGGSLADSAGPGRSHDLSAALQWRRMEIQAFIAVKLDEHDRALEGWMRICKNEREGVLERVGREELLRALSGGAKLDGGGGWEEGVQVMEKTLVDSGEYVAMRCQRIVAGDPEAYKWKRKEFDAEREASPMTTACMLLLLVVAFKLVPGFLERMVVGSVVGFTMVYTCGPREPIRGDEGGGDWLGKERLVELGRRVAVYVYHPLVPYSYVRIRVARELCEGKGRPSGHLTFGNKLLEKETNEFGLQTCRNRLRSRIGRRLRDEFELQLAVGNRCHDDGTHSVAFENALYPQTRQSQIHISSIGVLANQISHQNHRIRA